MLQDCLPRKWGRNMQQIYKNQSYCFVTKIVLYYITRALLTVNTTVTKSAAWK